MATSSSFFTLRRGSTKSLTFQVYGGKQVTKDRVGKPANPQTALQMEQRIKLAPVAQTRSLLKPIINHSFEGVNYGMESVRYFSKINLDANNSGVSFYGYTLPGWSNIGIASYQISKGSLLPLRYRNEENSCRIAHVGDYTAPTEQPETVKTIVSEIYKMLGLQDDDQLSLVYAVRADDAYHKEVSGVQKTYPILKWRVDRISKNDPAIMSAWSFKLIDEKNYITDGQVYLSLGTASPSEGAVINVETMPNENEGIAMFAAVASRPDGATWKRSTQFCAVNTSLVNNSYSGWDLVTANDAIDAITKKPGSSKYLNSGGTGSIEMVPMADINV